MAQTATDLVLIKVESARALLAQARDASSAKRVADLARAAEVYGKRQRLSEESIRLATAIRIDAMTVLGGFIKADPPPEGRPAKNKRSKKMTVSLASLGLSKNESSDAQFLATLPTAAREPIREGKETIAKARRRARHANHRPSGIVAPTSSQDLERLIETLDDMEKRKAMRTDHPEWFAADDLYDLLTTCVGELAHTLRVLKRPGALPGRHDHKAWKTLMTTARETVDELLVWRKAMEAL